MSEYVGEYIVSLTAKTFTDLRFHRHEEVVRCRDCVYRGWSEAGGHFCSRGIGLTVEPDGFCAWGECKDGDVR